MNIQYQPNPGGPSQSPQRATGEQKRWRVRMLLLHAAMLSGPLVLLAVRLLFRLDSLGICAFRAILGADCPACGITRSATALYVGNLKESFHHHPAGPIIVGIIAATTIYFIVVVFTNWKGFEWEKEVRLSDLIELTAVVILFTGWLGKSLIN